MKYPQKPIFKRSEPKVVERICLLCSITYWESESRANRNLKSFCCTEHGCIARGIKIDRYRKKKKVKNYLDYLEEANKQESTNEIKAAIKFYKERPYYLRDYKGL